MNRPHATTPTPARNFLSYMKWKCEKYRGEGTFGVVYSSVDRTTNDIVAIKVIEFKSHYTHRVLHEIEALNTMRHVCTHTI